ncbi:MAG: Rrf2 family transcriptional regulator [Arcobacteraceae bacterium]|jgi:Rrf2 family protein|nr:Rrf2 family transcriptional regulator [Arcobacteraceae bacterium]
MKLNTTSQYAINIVTFIVQNGSDNKYTAKDISEKLSIPYKYMTKIMTLLVDGGIISSSRGREGGYSIEKELSQITIENILEAVKESLHQKECLLGNGLCDERKKCLLHDKWNSPKKAIKEMFQKTTLEDILLEKTISFND